MRRLWRSRKILAVVGGEKVDPDIYKLADFNISITTQPHSEVAAPAVFLDWLQGEASETAIATDLTTYDSLYTAPTSS